MRKVSVLLIVYTSITIFFFVLLGNIFLFIYQGMYFPSKFYEIAMGLVCFILIFISWVYLYPFRDDPHMLKASFRIKAPFSLLFLVLTGLLFIIIVPLQVEEIYIIAGAWLFSHIIIVLSFAMERHYSWFHILSGEITIRYREKLQIYLTLYGFLQLLLTQYLLWHYCPSPYCLSAELTMEMGIFVFASLIGILTFSEIIDSNALARKCFELAEVASQSQFYQPYDGPYNFKEIVVRKGVKDPKVPVNLSQSSVFSFKFNIIVVYPILSANILLYLLFLEIYSPPYELDFFIWVLIIFSLLTLVLISFTLYKLEHEKKRYIRKLKVNQKSQV